LWHKTLTINIWRTKLNSKVDISCCNLHISKTITHKFWECEKMCKAWTWSLTCMYWLRYPHAWRDNGKGYKWNIAYLTKDCPRQFNNLNQFKLCFVVSRFGSYGLWRKNLTYNNYRRTNEKLAKLVFLGKGIPLT
jgi:hypothetical protein